MYILSFAETIKSDADHRHQGIMVDIKQCTLHTQPNALFPHSPKGIVHDVCVVPTLIELQEQYRHSGLLALLEQRLYFKNNSRRNFLPFPSCCRSEVRR